MSDAKYMTLGELRELLAPVDDMEGAVDSMPVHFDTSDRGDLMLLSAYVDEDDGVVRLDIGDATE